MSESKLVLSLDGGGIRGVFTAAVLERLEEQVPFLERVDLFAGTSVGGILALGLASGITPARLRRLLEQKGKDIFANRDLLDRLAGPVDELARADYDNRKGLRDALDEEFEADTLGHLPKKVLIPTFDLYDRRPKWQRWKPKFLHNYDTDGNDKHVTLVDAAMQTSAAPTYFPSRGRFVDGGVAANNPAMSAVAKVVRNGTPLQDVKVLSIGTGTNLRGIEGEDLDWGKTKWGMKLIPMLLDGMEGIADYQCKHLLGAKYCRVNKTFEDPIDLDAVDQIPALKRLAADCAQEQPFLDAVAWLRNL